SQRKGRIPEVHVRNVFGTTQGLRAALPAAVLLIACASVQRVTVAPLSDEAELHVLFRASGSPLDVVQAAAIDSGGLEIPLEIRHGTITAADRGEKLLAFGRLPPGRYTGLSLKLKKDPPESERVDVSLS